MSLDLANTRLGPESLAALAELVGSLRPDWDSALIRAVLHNHADRVAGVDLAIAVLRAAAVEDFRSPKMLNYRGPHWDLAPANVQPPAANESTIPRCRICGRTEARCYSDRPKVRDPEYADDHRFEPVGLTASRRLDRPTW